jgi:hypothetical protein
MPCEGRTSAVEISFQNMTIRPNHALAANSVGSRRAELQSARLLASIAELGSLGADDDMLLSSATPEKLPDIQTLRRLTKSIAMLDAILCPEWEYRYYSYDSKWGKDEEMASMRNGCGDHWFLLFNVHGAALKGFAHEYPLAGDASFAARIQSTVPPVFASFLHEPAFSMAAASFCIWRSRTDPIWSVVSPATGPVSPEEDGSAELLGIFDGNSETYRLWAEDYYEREIAPTAVRSIDDHQALSDRLVTTLNVELALPDITKDAIEIGYPYEPST